MNTLQKSLRDRLCCPGCKGSLSQSADVTTCRSCGTEFPVVRGVPVLIDESKSVFRLDECVGSAMEKPRNEKSWREVGRRLVDRAAASVGGNLAGVSNLAFMADKLREESPGARVLVLGGGSLGVGMAALVNEPSFSIVESDVMFSPRTNLICDAHEIPFADGTFDAIVAQGVLEYAINPFHAVEEMHRVLRPGGFVYAESPFMQQVHGGPYDFFRFTHVGHRRLFHRFEEVRSGVVCGPGMALSWSCRYFVRSLVRGAAARAVVSAAANLMSFWLPRLDRSIQQTPGAFDAASAFYFLGRRSEKSLSYRDTLATYRGEWKLRR